MTECSVPRCGQAIPKDRFICSDCKRVLRQDLASIPGLVEDLLTTITRQDVLGASGGRRAAETAISWKEHATEALWDLHSTVTLWTLIMLGRYKLTSEVVSRSYDGLNVHHRVTKSSARWLLSVLDSVCMQPEAGEVVDEISVAVQRAYKAIDRPAEKLPAGQCLVDDCPTYLYAEAHADTVDCPTCNSTHSMDERHAWMSAQMAEYRLTGTEALGYVHMLLKKPVPDGTWRRWVAEGRIRHDDMDHVGHKLYRWGDVVEAVRDWMARPRKPKEGEAA